MDLLDHLPLTGLDLDDFDENGKYCHFKLNCKNKNLAIEIVKQMLLIDNESVFNSLPKLGTLKYRLKRVIFMLMGYIVCRISHCKNKKSMCIRHVNSNLSMQQIAVSKFQFKRVLEPNCPLNPDLLETSVLSKDWTFCLKDLPHKYDLLREFGPHYFSLRHVKTLHPFSGEFGLPERVWRSMLNSNYLRALFCNPANFFQFRKFLRKYFFLILGVMIDRSKVKNEMFLKRIHPNPSVELRNLYIKSNLYKAVFKV
jgi:hypothetical protein